MGAPTASSSARAAWLRGGGERWPCSSSLARADGRLLRPQRSTRCIGSRAGPCPPPATGRRLQHQGPGDPAAAGEQHARHVSWGQARPSEGGSPPHASTAQRETLQAFTTADLFPSRVFRLPLSSRCVCPLRVHTWHILFLFLFFKPFVLCLGYSLINNVVIVSGKPARGTQPCTYVRSHSRLTPPPPHGALFFLKAL